MKLSFSGNEIPYSFIPEMLELKDGFYIFNGMMVFEYDLESVGYEKDGEYFKNDFHFFGKRKDDTLIKSVSFLYKIFEKEVVNFAVVDTDKDSYHRNLNSGEIELIESVMNLYCLNKFDLPIVEKAVKLTKDNEPFNSNVGYDL